MNYRNSLPRSLSDMEGRWRMVVLAERVEVKAGVVVPDRVARIHSSKCAWRMRQARQFMQGGLGGLDLKYQ